jgi:hypothetical protein
MSSGIIIEFKLSLLVPSVNPDTVDLAIGSLVSDVLVVSVVVVVSFDCFVTALL